MRPRRVRLLPSLLLALGGMTLSGCCSAVLCDACQPSGIYLRVTDAWTQLVLGEVTVSVNGQPCTPMVLGDSQVFRCALPAGEHTIDLEAPNYQPNQAKLTLQAESGEGCCLCGPIGYGTAELVPLDTMEGM
jgi:hypothetical protein